MASKVNVKFVGLLVLCIAVLAGAGVYVAGRTVYKSGADHFKAGKEWEAKGDMEKAAASYAKAVNKDRAKLEYLEAWIGALGKITPSSLQSYRDRFQMEYRPALAALAQAKENDADAQRPLLEVTLFINSEFGAELSGWEGMIEQTNEIIGRFPSGDKGGQALRRYRGIARTRWAEMSGMQAEDAMTKAKEDLEAAVAAEPASPESMAALGEWYRVATQHARLRRENDKADKLIKEGHERLNNFVAGNKINLPVLWVLTRMDIEEEQRQLTAAASFQESLTRHHPKVKRLIEQALSEPAEKVDRTIAYHIGQMAIAVLYPNAVDEGTRVVQHVLKARPDDVFLSFKLGELEFAGDQFDRALVTLDKLAKAPDRPLSIDGLLLFTYREQAMYLQARSLLEQITRLPSDAPAEKRTELLTRAKAMREDIANRFGHSPPLTLLDAQLKYFDGDLIESRRLLSTYTSQRPNDPSALRLQAEVLMRTSLTGEAQLVLEKLLQIAPNDINARLALASVDKALGRLKEAADVLERAYAVLPDTAPIKAQVKEEIDRLRSVDRAEQSDDPLVRGLALAQNKVVGNPPDMAGALETVHSLRTQLEKENKLDFRAKAAIMQALMMLEDRDGVSAMLKTLSETERKSPLIQGLEVQLNNPDAIAAQLAAIDSSKLEPLYKDLFRYRIFRRNNRQEEALAELAKAKVIAPENAMVISAAFDEAVVRYLTTKAPDAIDEAKKLAETAARLDIDKLKGAIYRIRIEEIEGRLASAAAMAQQIVDADPANPIGHRLLGNIRMSMGRYPEALTSYSAAARIKPDDSENIKGQLRALAALGRMNEALKVARDTRKLVGNDVEFFRNMLILEGDYGNIDYAVEGWRKLRRQYPGDREARLALGQLLIKKEAWAEANEVIDEALAKTVDFPAMNLKATLLAKQGKLAEARALWDDFIATKAADKRDVMLYIAYAEFLGRNGDDAGAKKLLEDNRNLQTPKNAEIDRELGDVAFRTGDFQGCIDALTRALKTVEKDDLNRLRYRIIDCHLRMNKCEEAMKLCDAAVTAGIAEDQTLLLLRSQAAICMKDYATARNLLQRAIAADVNNPLGYFQRATFFWGEIGRMTGPDGRVPADKLQEAQQLLRDAGDDLTAALRLDSNFANARGLLAKVRRSEGNATEAVKILTDGLTIDPRNSELRRDLAQLYEQMNQIEDAVRTVDAGNELDGHPQWPLMKGTLMLKSNQPAAAAAAFGEAWGKGARSPELGRLYAETLLNQPRPELDRIMAVLADKNIETEKWSPLLTMRARIYRMQGKITESDADIKAAFKVLNGQNPNAVASFLEDLNEMYAGKTAEMLALVDTLRPAEGFSSSFRLQIIRFKLTQKDMIGEALRDLDQIAAAEPNKDAVYVAMRQMGDFMLVQKSYDAAVQLYRRALEIKPNDFGTMNNLAYTLSKFLQKHEEALPFAQKSADAAPNDPNVLDTLGSVQLAMGKVPDADATFQRAISKAARVDQQVPIWIHLAQVSLAKGDRPGAVDYLQKADREISRSPELRARFGSEYDDVKRKVDGGR